MVGTFRLVHYYETQVADPEFGFRARFLVFPAGSLESFPDSFNEALELLGLTRLIDVRSPAMLSPALAVTLTAEASSSAVRLFNELVGGHYGTTLEREPSPESERLASLLRFTDASVFRELIPFESSPLHGESLAGLFAKWAGVGTGTAIGAVAAVVAVSAGSPLLILFVPLGIILCGAAKGVSMALEEGLYKRILKMLRVSDPMADESKGEDE